MSTKETAPVNEAAEVTEAQSSGEPDGEGSQIGRLVAILTPVLAIFAGWIAGYVAQHVPGAHLDQAQLTAFMVATMTSVVAAAWKWLQGWQQHERHVAEGKAKPHREPRPTRPSRAPRKRAPRKRRSR
jgi:predicted anti-sigma-YlaC factor YlaD